MHVMMPARVHARQKQARHMRQAAETVHARTQAASGSSFGMAAGSFGATVGPMQRGAEGTEGGPRLQVLARETDTDTWVCTYTNPSQDFLMSSSMPTSGFAFGRQGKPGAVRVVRIILSWRPVSSTTSPAFRTAATAFCSGALGTTTGRGSAAS